MRRLKVGSVSILFFLASPTTSLLSAMRSSRAGKTLASGMVRYCGGRRLLGDLELRQMDRLAVHRGDDRILGRRRAELGRRRLLPGPAAGAGAGAGGLAAGGGGLGWLLGGGKARERDSCAQRNDDAQRAQTQAHG